jgi:murein DD-endopeptidase MepM/ murein hydrolase activator NlpD
MEVENVSIKNFFNKDRFSKRNILDFFDRKGFYIIVVLCIAVIGVTAFIVTSNRITSSDRNLELDDLIPEEFGTGDFLPEESGEDSREAGAGIDNEIGGEELEPIDIPLTEDEEKVVMAEPEVKSEDKIEETAAKPENDGASAENSDNVQQRFIMPVTGEITFDYAMDRLVYSKTLDDWRTHSGIDIAAQWGTNVKAVADGVVTDIKNDPRLGVTVIVDHGDGIMSVYCNLASGDAVSPNQKVKQGDYVGCVGNTALFESAEQPHLHFEVLKDNEPVDPKEYLPIVK